MIGGIKTFKNTVSEYNLEFFISVFVLVSGGAYVSGFRAAAAELHSSLQAGARYTVFSSSGVTCQSGCFRPLKTALYC